MKQKQLVKWYILLLSALIFTISSCSNPIGSIDNSTEKRSKSIYNNEIGDKKLVAYFAEWGIYAVHNYYNVMDMQLNKITHINYAFVRADESNNLQILDPFASEQKDFGDGWDSPYAGNLGQLIKAKELYPHLKTVISVGGWTKGDQFHRIALTETSRKEFAANCVGFIRKWNFDGVDIDWEYPGIDRPKDPGDQYDLGCPGGPEDEHNYTYLLRDLRNAIDAAVGLPLLDRDGNEKTDAQGNVLLRTEPYILSIASSAGNEKMELVHPEDFTQYLDYINIMGYDMHGGWESVTGHNAPLYKNPADPHEPHIVENYNVEQAVNMYLSYNVSPSKLNLGLPYYSRGWANVEAGSNNGLFSSGANSSLSGVWGPGGQNPYYEIKNMVNQNGWIRYWDDVSKVPWLYNSTRKEMLTYDDAESLTLKTTFAMSKNLGGMMIWEIDADYENELTNAVYAAMVQTPDIETPTVPSGLIAGTSTSNSISLTWTESIDNRTIAGYKLYLDNVTNPALIVSTTYATFINLIPDNNYSVQVSAFDGAGNESAKSVAIILTTDNQENPDTLAPEVPVDLQVDAVYEREIDLSWKESSDHPSGTASGYDVYLNGVKIETVNTNSVKLIGLTPDTTYSITIRAFDSANTPNYSDYSETISATTTEEETGSATGVPGNPQLTKNVWDGESTYSVISNMWWGNNATKAALYENNALVETKILVDNSPYAQRVSFDFSNKPKGTYKYTVIMSNRFGRITSSEFSITVTQSN